MSLRPDGPPRVSVLKASASRPPMWKLVIEDDEAKRTLVPLTRAEYTIGRREGNVIRLTERNVSRDHARLVQRKPASAAEAATFVVEDLTSYNGVFVNGMRISHGHLLTHGDLVQIGDYRIVFQDESLATQAEGVGEAKQTVPSAPNARASTLLDRPNRLVMVAGPTPGAEFPLDRDRMTIGRAEDANISVNHNSVSRLHCEVHALGDGRFEIVDKGSSNGVRVNGSELKRGIVEPGDVIELGDARFKFIGAGQIFLPTESQPLSAIADRDASEDTRGRRAGNAIPMAVFAVVVCAGAAGAWAYTRQKLAVSPPTPLSQSSEQQALLDAKRMCSAGECDAAHAKIQSTFGESSRWRDAPEFKEVESQWAEATLARAEASPDPTAKRGLYEAVSQTMTVDGPHRKVAADRLQQLETALTASANAMELPLATSAVSRSRGDDAGPVARSERKPAAREPEAAPASPSAAGPSLGATGNPANVDDRERQLALQGTQDAKVLLKQHLEPRVYSGHASDAEVRLLISTCKDLGDRSCVQQARVILNAAKGN